MNLTFGARLRQQREERQVTLTTISTKTKIKIGLLDALESDDLSFWPKGLFGRAYLRDYATAIGLEPETVVGEFLSLHPEFAYVTPQVEEAEANARQDTRGGAAEKFRRFVSSAFSGRAQRPAIAPAPRRVMPDRLDFDPLPQVDAALCDEGPVLAGPSMAHALAEAEERTAIPFVEIDTHVELQDGIGDSPEELPFLIDPIDLPAPPVAHETCEISLPAMADVCTRLARAIDGREVTMLLADAARLLDAVGMIVWQWDPMTTALRPSLACGYSDSVVARLPEVRTGDENAVAFAFRSGEQCVVDGACGTEAVVVPSLGVGGCVGVLAIELRPGTRKRESVCAFTNILAAQLAMLLPSPEPVQV
jgi:hypothetical protein